MLVLDKNKFPKYSCYKFNKINKTESAQMHIFIRINSFLKSTFQNDGSCWKFEHSQKLKANEHDHFINLNTYYMKYIL